GRFSFQLARQYQRSTPSASLHFGRYAPGSPEPCFRGRDCGPWLRRQCDGFPPRGDCTWPKSLFNLWELALRGLASIVAIYQQRLNSREIAPSLPREALGDTT